MSADRSADPGAAGERTSLAWQRTALSLVAAAAVMARLTWSDLGYLAVAVLAAAAALSLWVFVESRFRGRVPTDLHSLTRGGRTAVLLAAATALIAGTELAALLT